MTPKRRAAASKLGGKNVKREVVEPPKTKDAFTSAKEALLAAGPQVKVRRRVDEHCSMATSAQVHEDYDCVLNHTDIGQNINEFYVIQVIQVNNRFHTWTRWGRVGVLGWWSDLCDFNKPESAVEDFEKKFADKTQNEWRNRANFLPQPGMYSLTEVVGEEDEEVKVDTVDGKSVRVTKNVLPCTLDTATQELIHLIFIADRFNYFDVRQTSLRRLSKRQIAKGFEVLEEIEAAVKDRAGDLKKLSSKFFTIIPHNFGMFSPPIINGKRMVEKQKRRLMVLAEVQLTQTLKSETEKAQEQMVETVPHPIDQDYSSLECKLSLMEKDTETFKIIQTYVTATAGGNHKLIIVNLWEVNRGSEREGTSENDSMGNRRLLWHGTHDDVVASILKNGLMIMSYSGGRAGRGIYFASEICKSANYVYSWQGKALMFLSEVILGKEYTITQNHATLTKAPRGCDSVVARGSVEPDPSKDVVIKLEGKEVSVAQGEPLFQPQFSDSHFNRSEYIIYKESQCCLRFLLELNM